MSSDTVAVVVSPRTTIGLLFLFSVCLRVFECLIVSLVEESPAGIGINAEERGIETIGRSMSDPGDGTGEIGTLRRARVLLRLASSKVGLCGEGLDPGRKGDLFLFEECTEVATELSSDASSMMSSASGRMEVICFFLFLGLEMEVFIVSLWLGNWDNISDKEHRNT